MFACTFRQSHCDVACSKFCFQFFQLLVKNELSHMPVHITEDHGTGETIDEFGLEYIFHLFHHCFATAAVGFETDAFACMLRTCIACHDEHDVSEV